MDSDALKITTYVIINMVIKMTNHDKFVVEEMPDLTTNIKNNPYASQFRNELLRYSSNNIVLENGQMIYIDLSQELIKSISEYNMEIFINILRSENKIIECEKIIDDYKISGKNNSNTYIKNCYDVIINMDQVYKYVWNICKLLNDDVEGYNDYLQWQKDKINIDSKIYDDWSIIYNIRNEIEHPGNNLFPTLITKVNNVVIIPTITYKGKKYDLLSLAKQSLEIASIFARLVIGASFLYSKYTKAFTDENRMNIYIGKEDKEV